VASLEGYSSASSHDNHLPLVARDLLLPTNNNIPSTSTTTTTTETTATGYASLSSAAAAANNNNTVAEFLYQLSKMLSDDNRDIIEWSNGTIDPK
jgi:hypothetical protein